MNFSLELETQKNNELLAYLHQPILELSDSLRAVSHYSELENSFVKLKDYHTRRMNVLWKRPRTWRGDWKNALLFTSKLISVWTLAAVESMKIGKV